MKCSATMRLVVTETIRCLFIGLFVYAAVTKYLDFQKFKTQIGQSPVLTAFAPYVAAGIPALELLVALLLCFQRFYSLALYASYGLMVIFSSYIVAITRFSDFIPCSCGGILQKMSWHQHLLFNLVFVLLSMAAILLAPAKTPILQPDPYTITGAAENLSIKE